MWSRLSTRLWGGKANILNTSLEGTLWAASETREDLTFVFTSSCHPYTPMRGFVFVHTSFWHRYMQRDYQQLRLHRRTGVFYSQVNMSNLRSLMVSRLDCRKTPVVTRQVLGIVCDTTQSISQVTTRASASRGKIMAEAFWYRS